MTLDETLALRATDQVSLRGEIGTVVQTFQDGIRVRWADGMSTVYTFYTMQLFELVPKTKEAVI